MAIIYLKATIDKNWHSQSFEFLSSKRVQKKFQKKFFKFFFFTLLLQNSCWKNKLGEFNSYHKYFAK